MQWSVAWESEPPLLVQCRDLLAHMVCLTTNKMGHATKPSDFIPKRTSEEYQLEDQRSEMLLWAARHNASLH